MSPANSPTKSSIIFDDTLNASTRGLIVPSPFISPSKSLPQSSTIHPAANSITAEYIRKYKSPSLIAFSNVLTNMPTAEVKFPGAPNDNRVRIPLFPYSQIMLPPTEATEFLAPDTYLFINSCGLKIVQGSITGAVIGVAMGIFFGFMGSDSTSIQVVNGREVPNAPVRELFRSSFKITAGKARGMALTFGVLTALFEGSECVVERYRSKHDVWNQVISGCFSGAVLSAKAGVGPACLGCVGFAGFSILVEKIMGPH